MTTRCIILVKIALVGVAITASGCTLGTNALIDDLPSDLTAAFGNAGGDHDNNYRGNGGNLPGGVGDQLANSGTNGGGNPGVGSIDGSQPGGGGLQSADNGPSNSGFGCGGHADAGGGNGNECGDSGALAGDMDPGNSGNSKGRSMTQD